MIARTGGRPPIETSEARFFWKDPAGGLRVVEVRVHVDGVGARVHVSGSTGTEIVAVDGALSRKTLTNPGAEVPVQDTQRPASGNSVAGCTDAPDLWSGAK